MLLLVLGCCLALNQVFDSYITPRVMGHTLGVHPAGVLIAAIIATDLIGLVGLVLAAPVLATVTLLGRYIIRKMLDMDPWPPVKGRPRVTVIHLVAGSPAITSHRALAAQPLAVKPSWKLKNVAGFTCHVLG